MFNKKDNGLNINTKKINSRINLSNVFTISSLDLNLRKQYELEFDKEDKKKVKKKPKNKKNNKKFSTNVSTQKNIFSPSNNNKRHCFNQDVYSMNKSNNIKLWQNNKFIEDYYEGNNDTTVHFDNDNSIIKINDKVNNISNHTYNDSKEINTSKKLKKKKKLKLLNDV